ncbi:uncharacterized protein MYCFIDRAFT_212628 [Pseudocercospora fijiensis CIRAD86]|uniref:Uncharacterized protein n=1 Tax=Pseudocercospora fijiensis (strain CIRAD86) TaxID=383855 RepID=M3A0Z9_PSEFD|nr:uncharacterized protein MYCFIDRAFT_212628 [Pseudocercospora fijiensis CIRAD86]EME78076.1 hypothetical protein MYCFIDRAFT_212628 [Pseudocercospora fijiensis CIRAD86]
MAPPSLLGSSYSLDLAELKVTTIMPFSKRHASMDIEYLPAPRRTLCTELTHALSSGIYDIQGARLKNSRGHCISKMPSRLCRQRRLGSPFTASQSR